MRKLLLIILIFEIVLVGCSDVTQTKPIKQVATQPVKTSSVKTSEFFPTLGGSLADFEKKYGKIQGPFAEVYDKELHANIHPTQDDITSGNVDHLDLTFDLGAGEKYSSQKAEAMCSYFMPSDKKLVTINKGGFKNGYVTWDYGAIFQSKWLAGRFPDKEEFATYSDGATKILQYNPPGTFFLLTRPLKNNKGFCVIEVGVARQLVNK